MGGLLRAGSWLVAKAGAWKWPLIAGGTAVGALTGADVAARAEDSAAGGLVNSVLRMFGMNQTDVGVDVGFSKIYQIIDGIGQLIENITGPSEFTQKLRGWAQDSISNVGQDGPSTPGAGAGAGGSPSNATLGEAASNDWNSLITTRADGGTQLNWSGLGTAGYNAVTGFAHGAVTAPAWVAGGALDIVNSVDNFLGINLIGDSEQGYRNDATGAASGLLEHVGINPDLEGSAIARTFNFAGGVVAGGIIAGPLGVSANMGMLATSFAPAAGVQNNPDPSYRPTTIPAVSRTRAPAPVTP